MAYTTKSQNLSYVTTEYEVHQFGPKDSVSQNFSFLALKEKTVGVIQILCHIGNDA
jgi:hypothetical protein